MSERVSDARLTELWQIVGDFALLADDYRDIRLALRELQSLRRERAEQETLLAERNRQNAELSMYSAAIDACRDACRAIMGNDVLAFVDDDVARALLTVKARADAGDALLREARDVISDGLESDGDHEPGWSRMDRELVARIDAHLAGEAMGAREGM